MSVENTPIMQQYAVIRDAHPGFLLFFRMGDFYELFGEQAELASGLLGITLTRRRTSKQGDDGLPMCGVPYHAAEGYIAKLLGHGHKVALCEQTETPAQAKARDGAKALVNREVVRLYTGGTLTEDNLLPADEANHLCALAEAGGTLAIGWLELSTGEVAVTTVGNADACDSQLAAELARLNPGELLLPETLTDRLADPLTPYFTCLTHPDHRLWAADRATAAINTAYGVAAPDGLGLTDPAHIAAVGALLAYAEHTQSGKLPALGRPTVHQPGGFLQLDAATRTNLELTRTLRGDKKGSLLSVIDHTVTPAGHRKLADWLAAPLADVTRITRRQQAIATLLNAAGPRGQLRDTLKHTADLSRGLSRLTLSRGSPRDLAAVRDTLAQLPALRTALDELANLADGRLFADMAAAIDGLDDLHSLLAAALKADDLPLLARDGGFIAGGYCDKLDSCKQLASGGMDKLTELERRETERTGISSLRVRYNKVWGYYIEVTKAHATKIPVDYIHRQTTTNSQRFTTPELAELERAYSTAAADALAREQEIFLELTHAVGNRAADLLLVAETLASLDVLAAGAELADRHGWAAPTVDMSDAFDIQAGRHPVVEKSVSAYVPNDCALSGGKLWLVTGPNMAGKSTFLRQNALIAILAHMGFYVPAKTAHIGVMDRIFTRIGAADDLARGQSTFMLEMVETAAILNGATNRSLVILDEIGRGTATYDGLSIAWACVEHLAGHIHARALFATHYHELTALAERLEGVSCHHVTVREWESDIVFLHEVKPGAAPRSYGIHVGRLAGLPQAVTDRAEAVLAQLEGQGCAAGANGAAALDHLPLFNGAAVASSASSSSRPAADSAQTATPAKPPQTSPLEQTLLGLALDDMTPRQAQEALYDLKLLAQKGCHPRP